MPLNVLTVKPLASLAVRVVANGTPSNCEPEIASTGNWPIGPRPH